MSTGSKQDKKHKAPLWWGPPKSFAERKHERKIGWLELFYDLVYVAAISQLTHGMSEEPNWHTVGLSFLFFSFILWSWVNGSQYYDLHGSDGIRTRLLTFWQMLAVAAVAITLKDAFEGHHKAFAISLVGVQLMITYLWWSVGLYDPGHRKFDIFYTISYLIGCGFLVASIFTSFDTAIILWIVALVFNFSPPLTAARTVVRELKKRGDTFTASAAIVERFGLFTIIVLAESILAIVSGVGEMKDKEPVVWIAFMVTILIAFLIWSLYFDMTSEQETKKGYSYMQWLIFLHYPLLASLTIIGASLKVIITEPDPIISSQEEWLFCISLSVILFSIVAITKIMEEDEESRVYIRPVNRLITIIGLLILLLPLFGTIRPFIFLSIIAVLLFIPVFWGIRRWVKYKYLSQQ